MSLEVAFHDAAAEEYEAALQWYENQRPALADALRDEVRFALKRILAGPEDFPIARDEIRTVRVIRFPYSVLYRVERDRILVVAVFHAKRETRSANLGIADLTRSQARRNAATSIYACRPRGESP